MKPPHQSVSPFASTKDAVLSMLLLGLMPVGLILILLLPFWIGQQVYNFQTFGKLDISLPKFGTPKSVTQCADALKKIDYAKDASINKNDVIELSYSFGGRVEPSDPDYISSYEAYVGMDSSAAHYKTFAERVERDVRQNCKGPVQVDYRYYYVKRMTIGSFALQELPSK
jgi:hypothetical protein